MSSLFYLGPDAHACRLCGAPFELADPERDRRTGVERRMRAARGEELGDWRSGGDRRHSSR